VAVHEAVLGAEIDVPTLNEPVSIKIPAGTPSAQTIRIAGRGVPPTVEADLAGDLLVDVQIVLPPVRDERSRELMREFGRLNNVDVRRHLFEE
jgi:molecular chaperone DnaJ